MRAVIDLPHGAPKGKPAVVQFSYLKICFNDSHLSLPAGHHTLFSYYRNTGSAWRVLSYQSSTLQNACLKTATAGHIVSCLFGLVCGHVTLHTNSYESKWRAFQESLNRMNEVVDNLQGEFYLYSPFICFFMSRIHLPTIIKIIILFINNYYILK